MLRGWVEPLLQDSLLHIIMISNWKVLQEVAHRYGDREKLFDEAAERLDLVKTGKIPLVSLENNVNRIEKRVARERTSLPVALERINGVADFQDVAVLQKLSELSIAVCRILQRGSPIGTGFMVSPEILITNHHVIPDATDTSDMLAEFNYELDANNIPKRSAVPRSSIRDFI
jgi:endonuclease G, mitochondrial